MRRELLIGSSAAAAGIIALVGLCGMRSPIDLHGRPSRLYNPSSYLGVDRGRFVLDLVRSQAMKSFQPQDVRLPGFAYRSDLRTYFTGKVYPGTATKRVNIHVEVAFWLPFLLFAAYPALSFVWPLVRTVRRRARQLCHNCGYSLIGNESGVCPECGEPRIRAVIPTWKRIVIAMLCAAMIGWVLEFLMEQLSLEHRVALWMIHIFGSQIGAWVITSTVRVLPSALVCVAVYLYLSPDRFPDYKR